MGRKIRFQRRTVKRDVIVVRGQFKQVALPNAIHQDKIYVYPGAIALRMFTSRGLDPNQLPADLVNRVTGLPESYGSGGGTSSPADIIRSIGSHFNRPVIFESAPLDDMRVSYLNSFGYSIALANTEGRLRQDMLQAILDNLSKQTSLEFAFDQQVHELWFITEET